MAKAYKWFAGDSHNPVQFEGLYTFTDEVFEIGKTYSIELSDTPHGRGYYILPSLEAARKYADAMMELGYDDWDYGTAYLIECEVDELHLAPRDEWDSPDAPEYYCSKMQLVKLLEDE